MAECGAPDPPSLGAPAPPGPRRLGEVIDEGERFLCGAGVWAPRDDAEVLTAHALGVDRTKLVPDTPVDPGAVDIVRELLARRANRIPLAHVTGRATLGGIEVGVGPGVFVPRPHTEPLLAWGLQVVRAVSAPVVVDLCCGSAAIALAVAHARPDAVVHAVECDPVALGCARDNAARRAAAGDPPIRLHAADVTEPSLLTELDGTVDVVLANPPNVAEGVQLLPEWGEHHPRRAIYAGADGLAVIWHVVRLAARLLRPGGGLGIEQHDAQAESLPALIRRHGAFSDVGTLLDHHGQPRHTVARKREAES